MSRIRLSLIVGGLAVILTAAPITTYAQRGGGGGGGGARGNRGGGPGGFGGGFGGGGFGGGGSLISLATREPVQEELKVSDDQKVKITELSTKSEAKNREMFQNLRQQSDASRAQLRTQQGNFANNLQNRQRAGAQNLDPRLQTLDPRNQALAGAAGPGGGFGSNPYTSGLPDQNGVDPNALRNEFRQQDNEARTQSRMMMQQAMTQLQNSSEQALAKILNRTQMTRLREIQLQTEGPFVVLKPEVAQKLEVNEDQASELQQAQSKINTQRGQIFGQMREVFQSFRTAQPAPADANGQAASTPAANANGNSNTANSSAPTGGRGRQGRGGNNITQGGPGGPGGPGGFGGPGGPGGPGGNRRGFDPEAMRTFMEKPEVQAKMTEIRQQEEALNDQGYALVFKTLDRRQGGTFRKMLGKKFDVSLLRRRPGGPAQPGAPATVDAPAATPAAAPAAKAATAPSTAAQNETANDAATTSEPPKSEPAAAKPAVRRRGSR